MPSWEAPIRPDVAGLRRGAAPPGAAASSIPLPPRRWRTRVLLPAALLAGLLAVFTPTLVQVLAPRTPVRTVAVVAKAAGAGESSGPVAARAAGWVEADPFPVYVPAYVMGVVSEVLVLEGERVEAGQVVARLDPREDRIALARAEAELAAREADLAAARTDWENPVERIRSTAVAAAKEAEAAAAAETDARMAEAQEARVEEMEAEAKRDRETAEAGASTAFEALRSELRLRAGRAELASLRAKADTARALLEEARAENAAAREGARLRVEERRALDAAKAEADRARAMRDEALLRVERLDLRAPAAGVIQRRLVAPGSRVMPLSDDMDASRAAVIYDPARLQVRVDVPLADAARVSVGQEARVEVEVLPGRIFGGIVTRLVNEADIQKNTLQFKVAIREPAPEVKPEMLARVEFLAAAARPAGDGAGPVTVFAPEGALLREEGGGVAAFVVDPGRGRVERRAVKPGGSRTEGWVSVESGLRPGDLLVEAPPAGLADGDRVRVVDGGR